MVLIALQIITCTVAGLRWKKGATPPEEFVQFCERVKEGQPINDEVEVTIKVNGKPVSNFTPSINQHINAIISELSEQNNLVQNDSEENYEENNELLEETH